MSVEHVFHPTLYLADGLQVAPNLPGVIKTSVGVEGSSPQMVRKFGEWILNTYNVKLVEMTIVGGKIPLFKRHLRHTLGIDPFWLPEQTDFHEDVPGELTNGAQTTFVVPFMNAALGMSDFMAFVGGVPQTSGYVKWLKSNYLSDDDSNAVSSIGSIQALGSCNIFRETIFAADGVACFKVVPTVAATNMGYQLDEADSPDLSEFDSGSDQLTFVGSVLGSGTFAIRTRFYDSLHAPLNAATSTAGTTGDPAEFTQITKTETAPANTKYVTFEILRTDSSDTTFWVACAGILPGDLERWFLPSVCPQCIEFSSAPTTGQRLSFSGTGQWLVRGIYANPTAIWKLYYDGDLYSKGFQFLQELDQ
jgi:hypothetical protein